MNGEDVIQGATTLAELSDMSSPIYAEPYNYLEKQRNDQMLLDGFDFYFLFFRSYSRESTLCCHFCCAGLSWQDAHDDFIAIIFAASANGDCNHTSENDI